MQEGMKLNFSERLGRWRIMRAVWCAIPWQFRPFVFPYCLFIYSRFLADSTSVDDVKAMHIEYCYKSGVFNLVRPRFRIIKRALVCLDTELSDHTVREAATTTLPIIED